MKYTIATLLTCGICAALTTSAAVLTKAQKSYFENRRICVKRDTTTLPGYVITTWHRNGKLDVKGGAVITNRLHEVVGVAQSNPLQAKLAEMRTAYAAATNRLLSAEARAARLDALRAHLVEKRDAAALATTKAIYQALIDRVDSGADNN